MADMIVDGAKLDACLDAEADAIRAKTGGSADIPFDFANNKGFADAIAAIPSGGTTITDGLIVTSRDANGYPLTADFYCVSGVVPPQAFFSGYASGSYSINTAGYWKNATLLTIKNPVTVLNVSSFTAFHGDITGDFSRVAQMPGTTDPYSGGANVFGLSGITEISLDSVQIITSSNFASCQSLRSVYAPKCTEVYTRYNPTVGNAPFGGCTALEEIQLGSIGYPCRIMYATPFVGCTQTGLTVTLFATGASVDSALSLIRNGATNATIIIKASEATTYNGTTYAAGDTILTSEVESTS